MRIKTLILTALLMAVPTMTFAQAKKPTTITTTKTTTAITPEQVVKNLYAAQTNEKTNPFDQTSRGMLDKYFDKDLAGLIWKKMTKTEDGWRHIDPLFDSHEQLRDSQDPKITNFVVAAPTEDGGPDSVYVNVTFKNHGEAGSSGFALRREAKKTWKITNIDYFDGDDLASILENAMMSEAEIKAAESQYKFDGDYMVGAMKCKIVRTISRIELYRVTCDGQDGFKLYAVDGNEKETSYIYTDDNGKQQGKFVIKNGENNGKFYDAAGKEMKVSRVPAGPESAVTTTSSNDSESESVVGELMVGKTESLILYLGEETGDYAAYCFDNASEAGRAILAKCKNKGQCEVKATLGDDAANCKVPGLEANLSAAFKIVKVTSARSLAPRK